MTKDIRWKSKDHIPVVRKQYSCRIPIDEMVMIEKKEGNVIIMTVSENIVTGQSMSELAEGLEGRDNICVCHSYLIINFDHVRRMENRYIHFTNGEHVYLGEKSFAGARKKYNAFICGTAERGGD